MTETTSAATALASQYETQVSGDLERNIKEQERIRAEIDTLQEQLSSLLHDHTVLVNIRQALGATNPPAATAEVPEKAGVVPSPRGKASVAGKNKRPAAKKAGSSQRRSADGKQARKSAAAEVTLVELIGRHLAAQSEPRSAAEVATDLGQAHPDRGIKTTVVRTTLENLVAKNRAQRSKQGTSVFYTAPEAPAYTATSEQPSQTDSSE